MTGIAFSQPVKSVKVEPTEEPIYREFYFDPNRTIPSWHHRENCTEIWSKRFDRTMKFLLTICVLILVAYSAYDEIRNRIQLAEEARLGAMFAEFLKRFPRDYKGQNDKEYRFAIFKQNVKEFESEEKKMNGVDFDITNFADWTDSELSRLLYKSQLAYPPISESPKFEGSPMPKFLRRTEKVDWRESGKVTHVKNQGSCGSCWAFATVAAVESQHAIKKGQTIALSEQQMVDCDGRNHGCRGGFRPYAMDFIKENGLVSEKKYPYQGSQLTECPILQNSTRVFIDGYRVLSRNEDFIADWVASKGPVSIGMNVTKPMYMYKSGIFDPSLQDCQHHSIGSHAVTVVGYDQTTDGKQYWIVKNSWGSSWGMNGYFYLARGVNSCGAANIAVAPIIS